MSSRRGSPNRATGSSAARSRPPCPTPGPVAPRRRHCSYTPSCGTPRSCRVLRPWHVCGARSPGAGSPWCRPCQLPAGGPPTPVRSSGTPRRPAAGRSRVCPPYRPPRSCCSAGWCPRPRRSGCRPVRRPASHSPCRPAGGC
ncbi:hypothetical protein EVA_08967 [gut metagenome]|uniref:Uncharacterized protein n=1 Tax=gut metagenome TaxID=749906 RepID=J9CRV3_9ZZZZ